MVSLTVSPIFIFFGFILMKFPPEKINGVYGYRTPMAMKNKDTWDVAQKLGGYSLIIFGITNAFFGLLANSFSGGANTEKYQLLFLVVGSVIMLIIDEMHLRKIFNKDGSRKI